ncbi:hypothetical protein J6590_003524 [Homalodisca vitripennis]|nr:hypothetical protein J6590_003524 [Homalodisca vitripennis]
MIHQCQVDEESYENLIGGGRHVNDPLMCEMLQVASILRSWSLLKSALSTVVLSEAQLAGVSTSRCSCLVMPLFMDAFDIWLLHRADVPRNISNQIRLSPVVVLRWCLRKIGIELCESAAARLPVGGHLSHASPGQQRMMGTMINDALWEESNAL